MGTAIIKFKSDNEVVIPELESIRYLDSDDQLTAITDRTEFVLYPTDKLVFIGATTSLSVDGSSIEYVHFRN